MTTARFDYGADPLPVGDLGAVHVIGIGGAGMSAVARLALQAGCVVSGSDARDSAVLAALSEAGARVSIGHDARNIAGADTVVISSAVREDNVELVAARAAGRRVLHRSQALAAIAAGRRSVAIAGANGKTTTTAMLTVALQYAGAEPSFAIGGELAATGANAALGTGETMVIEADESDGSFLAYRPDVAIVTNVQPDHLDFYGTFEAVQEAYLAFAESIRPGGLLVACADDDGSARLARRIADTGGVAEGRGEVRRIRVVTYGTDETADVRLRTLRSEGMHAQAVLTSAGREHELRLAVPGEHNLRNATAAFIAATHGCGAEQDAVIAGLASYTGTRRRFEPKGEAGGVTIIDDYAHNPGKVAAVVATARRLAGAGRLVVVFQPHLYSRTRDFAQALASGIEPADVAVVLDVYAAREDPMPGVTGELVARHLRGPEVHYVSDRTTAAVTIAQLTKPGDLLLTVGAGDVTEIGPAVLELLGAIAP
ncbi:MAG: UDP-N-acetylmuramate--L-alanine ligase [Micrococcales bacterium]|nr:UDP-N-acetylmuramate--L-alanine ligase [Micrococcales bacterium]